MSETKGERRERKRRKKRYGHKVSGRSVQTLQRIIVERAREAGREGAGASIRPLVREIRTKITRKNLAD